MVSGSELTAVGVAGVAAGLLNALAGGGSLISFPALVAVGIPPLSANATNTIALCPGYLGATVMQWRELRGQWSRARWMLPVAFAGGTCGAFALLHTSARTFDFVVPVLLLASAAVVGLQERIRSWLLRSRRAGGAAYPSERRALGPLALTAIYGGYFNAAVGVIALGALGVFVADSLARLNALKQLLSLAISVAAGFYFTASGRIVWQAALVVAAGSVLGGSLGGWIAAAIYFQSRRHALAG